MNRQLFKPILILLILELLFSTSVHAQSTDTRWNGNDVETMYSNHSTVYLYNVNDGKFIINGSNWGTRAVLKYQDYGISMTVEKNGDNYYLKTTFRKSTDDNSVYLSYAQQNDPSHTDEWNLSSTGFFVDQARGNGLYIFHRVEDAANTDTYTYKIQRTNTGDKGRGLWLSSDGTLTTYPSAEPGEEGHWRLVTQEQLNAVLQATVTEAYGGLNGDATYLIKGQNFARNDLDVYSKWTIKHTGSETSDYRFDWRNAATTTDRPWDMPKLTAEAGEDPIINGGYFNATFEGTGTCSQEITLPVTGLYKLQCKGLYANDGGDPSLLYVIIDGVETNTSLNNASSTYTLGTFNGRATRNTDKGLSAGMAFNEGRYPVELYFRGTKDQVIELGFKKQHSEKSGLDRDGSRRYFHDTDYTAFDDIQLKYVGTKPFVLDETKTDISYLADANYTNTTVLLKRSFSLGEWNSFVLPVSMTSAQVKQAFGETTELGKLKGLNKDNPNVIMFESIDLPAEGIAIESNQLYIIKPKLAAAGESVAIDDVIYEGPFYVLGRRDVNWTGTPSAEPITCYRPEGSTHPNDIQAKGTYIKIENGCPAGSYVFSGGDMYHTQSDLTIKGFRGWIEDINVASTSAKNFTFCLDGVEEEGIATALQHLEKMEKQPVNGIYNLNGQRVNSDFNSLDGLPRGIYIVNGKKLMVK